MAAIRIAPLLLCIATMSASAADGLIVAVASNFQSTARELASEFTRETGVPIRVTSGSTGHLYAQIVNGAPYDVFLAADTERPELLVRSGLADESALVVYATGQLVLWSSDPQFAEDTCSKRLFDGSFSRLAIANPETAPYGLAARRILQAAGIWDDVVPKLVFGQNVAQAFQFAATGNASFGLVAASQVIGNTSLNTSCLEYLPSDYARQATVRQAGVVLRRSGKQDEATRFMRFITSPEMGAFLQERGYTETAPDGS